MSSRPFVSFDRGALLFTIASALVLGYALALAVLFATHSWIIGRDGRPLVTDFMEVWVAGNTALKGAAALTYDPQAHHLAQVAMRGQGFAGYLGWHYPPFALFIAVALALIPYAYSFWGWALATTAGFLLSVRAIEGDWRGALIACAAPCIFVNAFVGQNGCFTAALFAAALLSLRERPTLAGILFGVLAYKPQFGILIPLALIAGGHWRTLWSAVVTSTLLVAAGSLAFGSDAYAAFFHYLPQTADAVLGHGTTGWNKIQSIYGLVRWLSFTSTTALFAQAAIVLICGIFILALWKRPAPFALKASGLVFAALLCTPYLYMYDFPIFVVGLAWLHKAGAFDNIDWAAIVLSTFLYCAFVFVAFPLGLPIAILGFAQVVRRVCLANNASGSNLSAQTALPICAS